METSETEKNLSSRPSEETQDMTILTTNGSSGLDQQVPTELVHAQGSSNSTQRNEVIFIDNPQDEIDSAVNKHNPQISTSSQPIDLSTPEPELTNSEQGHEDNLKRKMDDNLDVSMSSSPGRLSSPVSHDLTIENDIKRFKIDSSQASMVQNETPVSTQVPASQDSAGSSQVSYTVVPPSAEISQNDTLIAHSQGTGPVVQTGNSSSGKLTKREEERLAKQKLREAERLEREKKKEEERRLKKEEREKKELERKQKKELLEKEKQEKREQEKMRKELRRLKVEEEKRAKEQERKKAEESKERNQMRISSFFSVRPARKESPPPKVAPVSSSASATKASSPILIDAPKETVKSQPSANLYHSDFLPFFQKRNVLLAPHSQLEHSLLATEKQKFDEQLANTNTSAGVGLSDIFTPSAIKPPHTHTTSQQMVEALNSAQMTEAQLRALVNNLAPIKYLQFYENAKPPYVGTWCSEKHQAMAVPATQPLNTEITGYDYGYDSDLDWQEGDEGDGEDIDDLDEGDEEDEEAEDDEMEDFVEKSDSAKRSHVGPLQAVTIWNDGTHPEIFNDIKYERLHLEIAFPIDPFKDYWSTKPACETRPAAKTELSQPVADLAKPLLSVAQLGMPVNPVNPAYPTNPTNPANPAAPAFDRSNVVPNVLTPRRSVIQDEQVVNSLVEFIKENNDYSLGTLAELAQKKFKVFTKSILKQTIQEVAVYDKKRGEWDIK